MTPVRWQLSIHVVPMGGWVKPKEGVVNPDAAQQGPMVGSVDRRNSNCHSFARCGKPDPSHNPSSRLIALVLLQN